MLTNGLITMIGLLQFIHSKIFHFHLRNNLKLFLKIRCLFFLGGGKSLKWESKSGIKLRQIGVPIGDSSSRLIIHLCNLSRIVHKSQKL